MLLHAAILLLAIGCACGCKKKDSVTDSYSSNRAAMEKSAQELLRQARAALAASRFDEARSFVMTLREKYYLAITAREQAILFMDSVDLQQAKMQLVKADSTLRTGVTDSRQADFDEACQKVQFYERKLRYDKSRSGKSHPETPAK